VRPKREFRFFPRIKSIAFKRLALIVAVFWCGDAAATARIFTYYAPATARSFGMGGSGSADLSDVGNVALNPAVISFANGLRALGIVAPLSLGLIEINSASGMLSFGKSVSARAPSGLRLGVGVGWRHDKFELGNASTDQSDDMYHISGGGAYDWAKSRIGLGASLKRVPMTLSNGDDENATLFDMGILFEAGPFHVSRVSLVGAAGFSAMNVGDPVIDPLFGSFDALEFRRIGTSVCFFAGVIDSVPVDRAGLPPRLSMTVSFDVDSAFHTNYESRRQLGFEAAWHTIVFVRAGYVHDGILVDGARDGTVGAGLRWTNQRFEAAFDFARWPYYHDIYGNVFGLVLSYDL